MYLLFEGHNRIPHTILKMKSDANKAAKPACLGHSYCEMDEYHVPFFNFFFIIVRYKDFQPFHVLFCFHHSLELLNESLDESSKNLKLWGGFDATCYY